MTFAIGDRVHIDHIDGCGNHYALIGTVSGLSVPPYVQVALDGKQYGYSGGYYLPDQLTLMVGAQLAMPLLKAA